MFLAVPLRSKGSKPQHYKVKVTHCRAPDEGEGCLTFVAISLININVLCKSGSPKSTSAMFSLNQVTKTQCLYVLQCILLGINSHIVT